MDIPGFNCEYTYRVSGIRGGVALYIRNNIPYDKIQINVEGLEFMAALLPQLDLTVCVIYRPGTVPLRTFRQQLKTLIEKLTPTRHVIIGGDFNDDIKSNPNTDIYGLLPNYQQVIVDVTTSYNSLLDHIYVFNTNSAQRYISGVSHTYYSDHDATYMGIDL